MRWGAADSEPIRSAAFLFHTGHSCEHRVLMKLAPGMMISATVRLVELLGEGGMGSVWLAEHLSMQTRVAVKFMSTELFALEPSLRERFKLEASVSGQLRSVHVVQTLDHGTMDDDSPYIVMELLEGSNLAYAVETGGALSPREVGMVVSQVAKVLHRAHVLGIIHRDIKPDNIFLTDSEYELFVKVLDFGIAKQTRVTDQAKAITKTGAVVGTPEFMSPEQAIGSKRIDFRADLFSLGIVAYYALTGQLPFVPSGDEPYWLQMTRGEHTPPSELVEGLPGGLDNWFARALHPEPEERFQSANTMARAFAAFIEPSSAGQSANDVSSAGSLNADNRWGIEDEESHPAMYDLLGPDSESFPREATVLMDDDDHQAAEAAGEGPPTQRRPPKLQASPEGSEAAYAAVRSGAYNYGVKGAFNTHISWPAGQATTSAAAASSTPQPPDSSQQPEPETLRRIDNRAGARRLLLILLVLTVVAAVATAVVFATR